MELPFGVAAIALHASRRKTLSPYLQLAKYSRVGKAADFPQPEGDTFPQRIVGRVHACNTDTHAHRSPPSRTPRWGTVENAVPFDSTEKQASTPAVRMCVTIYCTYSCIKLSQWFFHCMSTTKSSDIPLVLLSCVISGTLVLHSARIQRRRTRVCVCVRGVRVKATAIATSEYFLL